MTANVLLLTRYFPLAFIIKIPQKYQVGNIGLSFSYNVATGFCTGILHGTGLISSANDTTLWPLSPVDELLHTIKALPQLWAQPMLLPTLLLKHNILRVEKYCITNLGDRYLSIQRQLGTSRAGRLHRAGPYGDIVGDGSIQAAKVNLRNLTGDISTFMTEITWFCQVSEWQCDCVDFLDRTTDEIENLLSKSNDSGWVNGLKELKDHLAYLGSVAKTVRGQNLGGKDVITSDFSVVSLHDPN